VVAQSGAPFNITAGSDFYDTTLLNGRPGLATDADKAGLIQTRYGLLDPNPSTGEPLLGWNYGRGPGQIAVNLRVAKTIGMGGERGKGSGGDQPQARRAVARPLPRAAAAVCAISLGHRRRPAATT
jgi:hypothetical protein